MVQYTSVFLFEMKLMRDADQQLAHAVSTLPKQEYTLFYMTTPPTIDDASLPEEPLQYEMDDSQSALHLELKRDNSIYKRANDIVLPDGPLFERYQFLTPGMFMGLITVLFLVGIAYGGISALLSLQVSYAAFDKENGPQAQKNKAQ